MNVKKHQCLQRLLKDWSSLWNKRKWNKEPVFCLNGGLPMAGTQRTKIPANTSLIEYKNIAYLFTTDKIKGSKL